MNASSLLRALIFSLPLLFSGSLAKAAESQWNLMGNGDWRSAANWTPNTHYPGQSLLSPHTDTARLPGEMLAGADRHVNITGNNQIRITGLTLEGMGHKGYILGGTGNLAIYNAPGNDHVVIRYINRAGNSYGEIHNAVLVGTNALTIRNTQQSGRMLISGNLTAPSNRNPIVTLEWLPPDYNQGFKHLALSGQNDFRNGRIHLLGVAGTKLQSDGASGGVPIHFYDDAVRSTLHLDAPGVVDYNTRLIVTGAGGGRLLLWRVNTTQASFVNHGMIGGITVPDGRDLIIGSRVRHAKLSILEDGVLSLGANALLLSQPDRSDLDTSQMLYLEDGAQLVGVGTLATNAPGLSLNRPVTLLPGAVLNPGVTTSRNSAGVLHLGSGTYPNSLLTLTPGAVFFADLNGVAAGSQYDQLRVHGQSVLTITGAELDARIAYRYEPSDKVFIIDADATASVVGTFEGLPQGATVDLGTFGGITATAKISYSGDVATQAVTGGNDVVLYDFAGTSGVGDLYEWAAPWQTVLAEWLRGVTALDVTITVGGQYNTRVDYLEGELRRNQHLLTGYAPLMIADSALDLPVDTFLWDKIWRRERLNTPISLRQRYGITNGEWWVPTHPSTGALLAWLHTWERDWNTGVAPDGSSDPTKGNQADPAVGIRAAVVGISNLLITSENYWYYNSGEPGARQPKYGVATGSRGFDLTFNAFTYLKIKHLLPTAVEQAWGEGLEWYAGVIGNAAPSGPENMQLSAPVGIYYTYLGTGNPALATLAQTHLNTILTHSYSPAGYIRDGGVPDGSYNGISLHRLAEYWSLTDDVGVFSILEQAYKLKEALTLVDPDGTLASPSHFNLRCQDGFDLDQYRGREVQFLLDVPEAGYFLQRNPSFWPAAPSATALRNLINTRMNQTSSHLHTHRMWESGWATDWEQILTLPYLLYHQGNESLMESAVAAAELPLLTQTTYTKNFNNEFIVIRRPAYSAIFYTGPARASDNGATNYRNMLQNDGGYMTGFGGGGLSAFWTPGGGTAIVGRMNAREAYERQYKTIGSTTYLLPGWKDWLNNQIVGKTTGGKILTSSRTPTVTSSLAPSGATLELEGVFLKTNAKQGNIISQNVSYQRSYVFEDTHVECIVEIHTDAALTMESLFESLPVREATGFVTTPRDTLGNALVPVDGVVTGVARLEIARNGEAVDIVFPTPVTLTLDSVAVNSKQFTDITAKNYLINLPTSLTPGTPVVLRYDIVPSVSAPLMARVGGGMGMLRSGLLLAQTPAGGGWSHAAIGQVNPQGRAAHRGGRFSLKRAGGQLGGVSDQLEWAWQDASGDGAIVAQLTASEGGESGVMFRASTGAGAAFVALVCDSDGATTLRVREGTALPAREISPGLPGAEALPQWLMLERRGGRYTGFTSADGQAWTRVGEIAVQLPHNLGTGVFHLGIKGEETEARFEEVSLEALTDWAAPQ